MDEKAIFAGKKIARQITIDGSEQIGRTSAAGDGFHIDYLLTR
jgi:hypothetical protein